MLGSSIPSGKKYTKSINRLFASLFKGENLLSYRGPNK